MADILTGRFGRLVQALFNLNQPLTLGDAVPDVMPVMNIEAPRPEMEVFSENDLGFGFQEQTGAALEFPVVSLGIGAGRSKLIVVEDFRVSCAVANFIRVSIESLTGTASNFWGMRDFRRGVQGSPAARVTSRSTAAPPSTTERMGFHIAAGQSMLVPCDVILASVGPSSAPAISVWGDIASTIDVSFRWRERPIGQQEVLS